MDAKSQRPKGRDNAISLLNGAIAAVDIAKGFASITPARAAFDIVGVILTTIRVSLLFFVGRLSIVD